mmetsp:Transcript_63422/g.188914  ORF Transcript_63422/g.188914 Transcript_63422/m.188914 type:complete len:401 (+) Transcript_63422:142-1344(+)
MPSATDAAICFATTQPRFGRPPASQRTHTSSRVHVTRPHATARAHTHVRPRAKTAACEDTSAQHQLSCPAAPSLRRSHRACARAPAPAAAGWWRGAARRRPPAHLRHCQRARVARCRAAARGPRRLLRLARALEAGRVLGAADVDGSPRQAHDRGARRRQGERRRQPRVAGANRKGEGGPQGKVDPRAVGQVRGALRAGGDVAAPRWHPLARTRGALAPLPRAGRRRERRRARPRRDEDQGAPPVRHLQRADVAADDREGEAGVDVQAGLQVARRHGRHQEDLRHLRGEAAHGAAVWRRHERACMLQEEASGCREQTRHGEAGGADAGDDDDARHRAAGCAARPRRRAAGAARRRPRAAARRHRSQRRRRRRVARRRRRPALLCRRRARVARPVGRAGAA